MVVGDGELTETPVLVVVRWWDGVMVDGWWGVN